MTSPAKPIRIRLVRGDAAKTAQRVAWPSAGGAAEAAGAVPMPAEPHVELQKQAEGGEKIIVTCTCGKRIEIACES